MLPGGFNDHCEEAGRKKRKTTTERFISSPKQKNYHRLFGTSQKFQACTKTLSSTRGCHSPTQTIGHHHTLICLPVMVSALFVQQLSTVSFVCIFCHSRTHNHFMWMWQSVLKTRSLLSNVTFYFLKDTGFHKYTYFLKRTATIPLLVCRQ